MSIACGRDETCVKTIARACAIFGEAHVMRTRECENGNASANVCLLWLITVISRSACNAVSMRPSLTGLWCVFKGAGARPPHNSGCGQPAIASVSRWEKHIRHEKNSPPFSHMFCVRVGSSLLFISLTVHYPAVHNHRLGFFLLLFENVSSQWVSLIWQEQGGFWLLPSGKSLFPHSSCAIIKKIWRERAAISVILLFCRGIRFQLREFQHFIKTDIETLFTFCELPSLVNAFSWIW